MVNAFLILLCIILAILFGKMTNVDIEYKPKLLVQINEVIERDNFSYIYILSHGPIILNLTSLLGDADLYISNTNMYPTYHPDSYNLHSATCGDDIIEIPESFESPLAVAIYGHAEYSVFSLEIYETPTTDHYQNKHFLLISKDAPTNTEETSSKINKPLKKKIKTKSTSSTIPSIFSLLEVVQLIFL